MFRQVCSPRDSALLWQCFETPLKFVGSDWIALLRLLGAFGIQWMKTEYSEPPCILVGTMGILVSWRDYGLLQAAFSVSTFGTATGGGMTSSCRSFVAKLSDKSCVALE